MRRSRHRLARARNTLPMPRCRSLQLLIMVGSCYVMEEIAREKKLIGSGQGGRLLSDMLQSPALSPGLPDSLRLLLRRLQDAAAARPDQSRSSFGHVQVP
jgi:hypothetical protein